MKQPFHHCLLIFIFSFEELNRIFTILQALNMLPLPGFLDYHFQLNSNIQFSYKIVFSAVYNTYRLNTVAERSPKRFLRYCVCV